jgi:DNA-binding response OmpR family regulator
MSEQIRILFVDDERMLRDMWSTILGVEGFHVAAAATVPEALAKITSEKYHVLIADLNVGEPGDGFTIVSAMRRIQPEAVTIILTGYPAFQAALRAIHEQVDDFLVKPTEPKRVVELIRQNLSRRRKPRALVTERLNQVIAKNRESIVNAWYDAVERHPDILKIQLSREERIDHLPSVLEELVRPMDGDTPAYPRSRSAAAEHGEKRRQQHYTVSM